MTEPHGGVMQANSSGYADLLDMAKHFWRHPDIFGQPKVPSNIADVTNSFPFHFTTLLAKLDTLLQFFS
jgi:hypothetical protein